MSVVFGTTFAVIAIGLHDGWPPFLASGLRFTIAGIVVLLVAAIRKQILPVSGRDLRDLAFGGLLVTGITFGLLYVAEEVLPSSLAALLSTSAPLFALLLGIALGRQRARVSSAVGIAVGTIGVALIVGIDGLRFGPSAIFAVGALLLSELAYAGGLTISQSLAKRLPTLQVAGGQQFLGGIMLLLLSAMVERRLPRIDLTGALAIGYLALIGSAVAQSMAIWLAAKTSPILAASWTYISPFIAVFVGVVWLHESITAATYIGGVLVVLGSVALNAETLLTLRKSRNIVLLRDEHTKG
jgi:drug/metabolite transporter (DMT)-like permease